MSLYSTYASISFTGYIKSTQGSVLEHVNIKNSHQIINLSQATDSLKRHWGHLNINAFTERNDPAKLYVYPDVSVHPSTFVTAALHCVVRLVT